MGSTVTTVYYTITLILDTEEDGACEAASGMVLGCPKTRWNTMEVRHYDRHGSCTAPICSQPQTFARTKMFIASTSKQDPRPWTVW